MAAARRYRHSRTCSGFLLLFDAQTFRESNDVLPTDPGTEFEQSGDIPVVARVSVAFTNSAYRDDFTAANRAAIDCGAVAAGSV